MVRVPSRNASDGSSRDMRHAGITPKSTPVTTETSAAKARTRPSIDTMLRRGRFCGTSRRMVCSRSSEQRNAERASAERQEDRFHQDLPDDLDAAWRPSLHALQSPNGGARRASASGRRRWRRRSAAGTSQRQTEHAVPDVCRRPGFPVRGSRWPTAFSCWCRDTAPRGCARSG